MEELSLKWDEHHPAVISVFEELLAKGTLVDCTIAADGQYMKAHKVVLAACSPYFEMLFSQESEKNPIVVLKDMKFQELKHLIDFVYRGQVKLPKDQLDAFVSAAESLQIKGLSGQQKKKISERFANKTVSSREVCSSPVPRKRRRNSHTETNEDSQSEPGNESSSDSNMRENFMPTPIPLGMPSTSTASSSTGISSHSVSSQQSRSLTDTRFPSHDQSSASSEQVLPDVQTVVKTEPEDPTEPLAQVFVPEPKNEEYVDDMAMLESGAGSSDMQGGTSQENTNNYPGYDSSGDTFLMNQMADQNTSSGAGSPMECCSSYGVQPLSDPLAGIGESVLPPPANILLLKRRSSDEHLISHGPIPVHDVRTNVREKCRLYFDNSDNTAHDAAETLIRAYHPKSYCKQNPVSVPFVPHPDLLHKSTSSTSNKIGCEQKSNVSSLPNPQLLNKARFSTSKKICNKQKPTVSSLQKSDLLSKASSSTSNQFCKEKPSTVLPLQDSDFLNKSSCSASNNSPTQPACEEEFYACAGCGNIIKMPMRKKRTGMIMTKCNQCGCVSLQDRKVSADKAKKTL